MFCGVYMITSDCDIVFNKQGKSECLVTVYSVCLTTLFIDCFLNGSELSYQTVGHIMSKVQT